MHVPVVWRCPFIDCGRRFKWKKIPPMPNFLATSVWSWCKAEHLQRWHCRITAEPTVSAIEKNTRFPNAIVDWFDLTVMQAQHIGGGDRFACSIFAFVPARRHVFRALVNRCRRRNTTATNIGATENAGVEKSGADCRGGKCRSGKCGSISSRGGKCWSIAV